jgi:hypothetical protein
MAKTLATATAKLAILPQSYVADTIASRVRPKIPALGAESP